MMCSPKRNRLLWVWFPLLIEIFLVPSLVAQTSFTLSGKVVDSSSGKPLVSASVFDVESGKGVVTDLSGFYQIQLAAGKHRISISFLGYGQIDTLINLRARTEINFNLLPESIKYEEVTITGEARKDYVQSIQMSEIQLVNSEISKLPALLGEADPIRFLQLTPGVMSSTEGGIGFYVRGGGVDQNLVLYDNSLIYNPGHLLGFLSVFNPDIVSGVSFIKSGIPARYGGRLSSVINVESYKGKSDSLSIKGQIGLVSSRLSLNRSFNKNKGSFILSARRASIDLFIKPALQPFLKNSSPYFANSNYNFYDLNASISYQIGKKDFISVLGYYGQDKYQMVRESVKGKTSLNWGNAVVSTRWNHVFSERTSLSNTLSITDYRFDLGGAQSDYAFKMYSSIEDYSLKSQLSVYGDRHNIVAGFDMIHHTFTPNELDVSSGSFIAEFVEFNKLYAWEGGVYIQDDIILSDNWSAGAGLRYSFFNQVGPYKEFIKDQADMIIDSIEYPPGESLAFYHQLEPRLSVRYQINGQSSLKASYMHIAQYIHLATSASVSMPMDIWLPSSKSVQPQIGDQVSLGYFRNFFSSSYESSIEVYYKSLDNQMEFIRGVVNNSLNSTLEENIAVGEGRNYGVEFFLRKLIGNTTGWIGYTLSRSERQFDRINDGRIYPAKYDRRHDLSTAVIHQINEMWSASAVFVYVSGAALTVPVGRYIIQGNLLNEYDEVNSFRIPPYHRLDLSATRSRLTRRGNVSSWNFSIYNVYSRANPFYILFETTGNLEKYQLQVNPRLVSLFPVIPSVSWSFEF